MADISEEEGSFVEVSFSRGIVEKRGKENA